jgi:hypothetical protein
VAISDGISCYKTTKQNLEQSPVEMTKDNMTREKKKTTLHQSSSCFFAGLFPLLTM